MQGRSDGGYMGIYSPPPKKKSDQVNFYGVKMMSERLFKSFIDYTPKKLLYPQKQISGYAPDWMNNVSELLSPMNTADADATQLSSCVNLRRVGIGVGGVNTIRN